MNCVFLVIYLFDLCIFFCLVFGYWQRIQMIRTTPINPFKLDIFKPKIKKGNTARTANTHSTIVLVLFLNLFLFYYLLIFNV